MKISGSSLSRWTTRSLAIGAVVASSQMAQAIPASTIAGLLGAAYNPGTAPWGVPGRVIAYDATGFQLTPYAPPYDYLVTPLGPAAGEQRDFEWVHESSGFTAPPSSGTQWLFPVFGTQAILDPAIDHDPADEEGVETTLWGSNDGGATWTKGVIIEVYGSGWDPLSIEENPSLRYQFGYAVNLISATAGVFQNQYSFASDDTEIDAVSLVVPEPASGLLLAGGLSLLSFRRR